MKSYQRIQMSPESWRQYCLLKRRAEWLKVISLYSHRDDARQLKQANARYSDVSMSVEEFGALLAAGKIKD